MPPALLAEYRQIAEAFGLEDLQLRKARMT
jgi:hypothetical protein